MPENTDTGNTGLNTEAEIKFKCKFCGKTRPLSELVVMRRYYPQMTACKECARSTKRNLDPD